MARLPSHTSIPRLSLSDKAFGGKFDVRPVLRPGDHQFDCSFGQNEGCDRECGYSESNRILTVSF